MVLESFAKVVRWIWFCKFLCHFFGADTPLPAKLSRNDVLSERCEADACVTHPHLGGV